MKRAGLSILVLLFALACSSGERSAREAESSVPESGTLSPAGRTDAVRIVFLGDSLTAGLGLPEANAFPALIERQLTDEGWRVRVINAGVSGDTSAGGLSRLEWLLRQEPDILFLSLGANDGLRGLAPEMTERNLREIVERGRAAGVDVVLAGMRLPPNYGPDYVERFEALFPRLARELDLAFVPFLLEGVAGRRRLNLADGIHPNAEGHVQIAAAVLPVVRAAVEELGPVAASR